MKIWSDQDINPNLIDVALTIGEKVLETITSPEAGEANVTQWCKKQRCWNKVKEAFAQDILLTKLESYRIDREKVKSLKKERRAINKIDSQYNAMTEAFNFKYWKDAYNFNRLHSVLPDSKLRAIYNIAYLQKYDDRNCKLALEALKDLRAEGFTK